MATKKGELPKYVNENDVFFYICDHKRKIADKKCTGSSCKFLKNGDCERTSDIAYAKHPFNWRRFTFLEHKEREGKYDYDIYSERNEKGDAI